ncbi:MAG: CoA pyrophosphatase [Desulfarculus sp.]|nr:CoA pyrophosphatase [Desulfarculus sp.]
MSERLANTAQALAAALSGRQPRSLDSPDARPAAVLMPLWEDDGRVQVVFTKRTATLPHHAGQISFPGGMSDPEDPDPETTALRETCAEIGVCQGLVEVVARLDQLLTITNFLVTPFLGVIAPGAPFRPNPVEVERLVVVPLAKVLDPASYRPTEVRWQGMSLSQTALEHQGDIIWGATGRMLLNLLEILGDEGRSRVLAAAGGNGQGRT